MLGSKGTLGLAGMIERELARRCNAGNALDELNKLKTTPAAAPPYTPRQAGMGTTGTTLSLSRWSDLIEQAGKKHGVDSALLAAVIEQESGGNPKAVSPKGAKGLMQLMDSTAADMGVRSSFSPRENIAGGAKYLRSLLDRFNGDEKLALASYNAGPGAVEKYGDIPPYAETRRYVDSVLRLKHSFQNNRDQTLNSLAAFAQKEKS
jgi:soluble lytic murein transglycosylase-like protein